MPLSQKTLRLRRDLRATTIDGAAYSLMVGTGEQYLVPFALAIGMGEAAAGLLASVPQLVGALLQMISPAGVRALRSHRAWVVASVGTQALCFVPLIIAAVRGGIPTLLLFAIASLYWASGAAAGGAWNTWMGTLIPVRLRSNFFAQRTRYMQVSLLAAMLIAGVVLQGGKNLGYGVAAFGVMFGLAAAARLLSTWLLTTTSEPQPLPVDQRVVPLGDWVRRAWSAPDGRLLAYLLAVQVSAYVAAPYFAPFMLKQLHLDYAPYVTLLAVAFAAKILMMPLLGRIAKEYGARALLWVGGVGIIPLAAMWIGGLSAPYWYLIVVQFLAGTFWGAYELGSFLVQFETLRQAERTSMLTTFALANSLALATGSLIGWLGLTVLGEGAAGYYAVFGASTVFRAVALILLKRGGVRRGDR
jgi:hypothetical protein